MQTVNATELARNTRTILERVASGETIALEPNNVVIAKIVPHEPTMNASQALAGLRPVLTLEQGFAWLNDSKYELDEALRESWA